MPKRSATRTVLDASAVLAVLNAERGADRLAREMSKAAISAVNLSEVVAKLTDAGMPSIEARATLSILGLDVHPFDREAAYAAGELRADTRAFGLSLGDTACLALGRSLRARVWTTDRRWAELRVGVEVRLAR